MPALRSPRVFPTPPQRRVTNCNPAGVIAEQASKHRARDAGQPADLRLVTGLQHASMLRGVGVRGSGFVCKDEARGPAFRAPSFIREAKRMQIPDCDAPGVVKNTGDGARLLSYPSPARGGIKNGDAGAKKLRLVPHNTRSSMPDNVSKINPNPFTTRP